MLSTPSIIKCFTVIISHTRARMRGCQKRKSFYAGNERSRNFM